MATRRIPDPKIGGSIPSALIFFVNLADADSPTGYGKPIDSGYLSDPDSQTGYVKPIDSGFLNGPDSHTGNDKPIGAGYRSQ